MCHRKTDADGVFLTPEDLEEAFSGVFKDFDVKEAFVKSKMCLCEVCAGLIKLSGSDALAAKMKISSAAGSASNKIKSIIGHKK